MNKVEVLYLRINKNCNARCFMCDLWKNKKTEIHEEQFKKIFNKLKNLKMVRFTGGEPLLCEKLPKYIAKFHSKGIRTSVITNGMLLDTKLDDLVKGGLDQIVISVDGSTSELHDSLKGVKGMFNKIDKALEKISKEYPSLHTRVNTVVSAKNLADLPNIARWLDKHHIEQWSIIPIKLDGYNWSKEKTWEDFDREYSNFKKITRNCKVKLMGYSASWLVNVKNFWEGNSYIRPKNKCYVTQMVTFFDPFKNCFYPCNCIPHRNVSISNQKKERKWYFEHGHEYCNGCEPVNAYCADFPETLRESVFNF